MVKHFKSKSGYQKWNAFRFMHGLNEGGQEKIYIHGKLHHVSHTHRHIFNTKAMMTHL
jgi:hypothetical protein